MWALCALLGKPLLNTCITTEFGTTWAELSFHDTTKADKTAEYLINASTFSDIGYTGQVDRSLELFGHFKFRKVNSRPIFKAKIFETPFGELLLKRTCDLIFRVC
jgi:hypothetical protein